MQTRREYIEECNKQCKDALNKGISLLPPHRQSLNKHTKPKPLKEFLHFNEMMDIAQTLEAIEVMISAIGVEEE